MTKTKLTLAKSVLALDIGNTVTRGFLFDVVEYNYRLIASSEAPSTHLEPVFDIGDAVLEVIMRLQEVTGRELVEKSGELIIPSTSSGDGVDQLFLITSSAPTLRVVAAGLLSDVSLESVRKLAGSTYLKIMESIGINDRRPINYQMDAIIAAKPDLVLLAGGTDDGATRSLLRIAELIISALNFLPRKIRPQVLYCGNRALNDRLCAAFERVTDVRVAPNIRPSLEEETLEPALTELHALMLEKSYEMTGGLKRIGSLCSAPPQLTNQAFHQVIKFLGRQYDPAKGVLGINVGACHSTVAFANDNNSILNTFEYGIGNGIEEMCLKGDIREITRWLTDSVNDVDVSDYLWNRNLFPLSIATTGVEVSIERALLRQVLRSIMQELETRGSLPSSRFEPILLSGSALNCLVNPVQSILTALDGIQPLGICPLILDKHGILPLLGAIAATNPLLTVQLLESTAFTSLATVVNVASKARAGSTLLLARLDYPDGNYFEAELKQGSIVSLPLPTGMTGMLRMRPARRVEIEDLALRSEPVKVNGGVCGVVMDARGRPIKLPEDKVKRIDLLKEWEFLLGAA